MVLKGLQNLLLKRKYKEGVFMGIRFRKSINLGGGLKLNLNKKSAGLSFGMKGARVSVNSDGRKTTSIGIPGTGLYWTKSTEGKSGLTPWNIITLILMAPFILLYWLLQVLLFPFKKIFKNKVVRGFAIVFVVLAILGLSLLFIDKLKFTVDNEIRFVSLDSSDGSLWTEKNSVMCYDEGITYLKDRDISITNIDFKKVGFLWYHKFTFEKVNLCDYEFYIEEKDFLYMITKGEVIENESQIDLSSMIKGKEAVVGNKMYPWEENYKYVGIEIDGK